MNNIPQVGQAAPDFTSKDQKGNTVSLKDKSDRWLVLYFYPKDNTPGCTIEAVEFSKYADEFQKLGADIIGVSPDSAESHNKFIDEHDLSIQLLSDEDRKVIEDYGLWKLQQFKDKEFMGVARSTFLISPDGKIAQVWEQVKVKNHVEEVLAELKQQAS